MTLRAPQFLLCVSVSIQKKSLLFNVKNRLQPRDGLIYKLKHNVTRNSDLASGNRLDSDFSLKTLTLYLLEHGVPKC